MNEQLKRLEEMLITLITLVEETHRYMTAHADETRAILIAQGEKTRLTLTAQVEELKTHFSTQGNRGDSRR